MSGKRCKMLKREFSKRHGTSPPKTHWNRTEHVVNRNSSVTKENPTGETILIDMKVEARSVLRKIKKGWKGRTL